MMFQAPALEIPAPSLEIVSPEAVIPPSEVVYAHAHTCILTRPHPYIHVRTEIHTYKQTFESILFFRPFFHILIDILCYFSYLFFIFSGSSCGSWRRGVCVCVVCFHFLRNKTNVFLTCVSSTFRVRNRVISVFYHNYRHLLLLLPVEIGSCTWILKEWLFMSAYLYVIYVYIYLYIYIYIYICIIASIFKLFLFYFFINIMIYYQPYYFNISTEESLWDPPPEW
jgi:hypothetical protein